MSTAVLSLEAFQERQLQDRFRARAHEALDELLNRLEAQMTEPGSSPPTLMDLTEAVSQERSVFTCPRRRTGWSSGGQPQMSEDLGNHPGIFEGMSRMSREN